MVQKKPPTPPDTGLDDLGLFEVCRRLAAGLRKKGEATDEAELVPADEDRYMRYLFARIRDWRTTSTPAAGYLFDRYDLAAKELAQATFLLVQKTRVEQAQRDVVEGHGGSLK